MQPNPCVVFSNVKSITSNTPSKNSGKIKGSSTNDVSNNTTTNKTHLTPTLHCNTDNDMESAQYLFS